MYHSFSVMSVTVAKPSNRAASRHGQTCAKCRSIYIDSLVLISASIGNARYSRTPTAKANL